MSLLDEVFKARVQRVAEHQSLPLYYRLSRTTLATHCAEIEMDWPLSDSGHVWGVPFVIDDRAPDGVVEFTTDFESWQSVEAAE